MSEELRLSELNKWNQQGAIMNEKEELKPKADEDYVGYCRYVHGLEEDDLSFESCDSDADGAFKVYRRPSESSKLGELKRVVNEMLEIAKTGGHEYEETANNMKWFLKQITQLEKESI